MLSKNLKVSRIVVREALQMLRDEHIIVTYHGKGSFVANPNNFFVEDLFDFNLSYQEFCDIMEYRSVVEFAAIELAVINGSEEDFDKIKFFLNEMKRSVDSPTAFSLNDYKFHFSIIEASHNSIFCEAMTFLAPKILHCLETMNKLNDSRNWAVGLHENILLCLLAKDAKGAISLLKNNGEYNFARLSEIIK